MSQTDDEQHYPPTSADELEVVITRAAEVIRAEEDLEGHIAALLEAPMDQQRGQRVQDFLTSEQMRRAYRASVELGGPE